MVLVLHSDSLANSGHSPKNLNKHLKPQVMKKTALTIGLFSLVAVATSFASTEVPTYLAANDSIKILPVDGKGGQKTSQDGRKLDVYGTSNADFNETKSFNSDRQSFGKNIKLD